MNAILQPRFKGATAFDVAVISNVLCRLASQPKYARHHRALKEMMSEIAITCDSVMELVGCSPETLDPVTLLVLEQMPEVGMEIFEDFSQRLKDRDPALMELVKQFPIT